MICLSHGGKNDSCNPIFPQHASSEMILLTEGIYKVFPVLLIASKHHEWSWDRNGTFPHNDIEDLLGFAIFVAF